MKKYFHYFLPLSPGVSADILEDISCLQEIPVYIQDADRFMIRLMGRPHTIDVIAISFSQEIPVEQRSKWIEKTINHMVVTLRLTYNSSLELIRNGDGFLYLWMETDNPLPEYKATLDSVINDKHLIDIQGVTNFFCETIKSEQIDVISLLAESHTPSIPTHYKILSLIRALEILFPNQDERSKWLNRYEDEFTKIEISSMRLRNAIPELRTKCAHGISRGGSKAFVSQAYVEHKKLPLLLKLLRRIIVDQLNEAYSMGMFTYQDNSVSGVI